MVASVIGYLVMAFAGGALFGSVLGYMLCVEHNTRREIDRRIQQLLNE